MDWFKRSAAALALLVAGALSAAAVAGKSPASPLQTTTGTTTGTTGTTTTGTTATTTVTTGTTTTTTTTTPPRRVLVCHHTNSRRNKHVTIRVSANALAAHLRHGDSLAVCTTRANVNRHSTASHVRRWHRGLTLRAELRAEAKGRKKK